MIPNFKETQEYHETIEIVVKTENLYTNINSLLILIEENKEKNKPDHLLATIKKLEERLEQTKEKKKEKKKKLKLRIQELQESNAYLSQSIIRNYGENDNEEEQEDFDDGSSNLSESSSSSKSSSSAKHKYDKKAKKLKKNEEKIQKKILELIKQKFQIHF